MLRTQSFSCVQLFVTPLSVALHAPLSMGFSRQEYWNGLPFPSPGGLPDPEMEPKSPAFQEDSLPSEPPRKPKIHNSPPLFLVVFSEVSVTQGPAILNGKFQK